MTAIPLSAALEPLATATTRVASSAQKGFRLKLRSSELDNLIAKDDIPVTIALFVAPGDKGPGLPIYGGTDNRSVEYDSVDDHYASFLINELMPAAVGKYRLSQNPADCCIYGLSSSGVSALAVAHEKRPIKIFMTAVEKDLDIVFGHWLTANRAVAKALEYRGYDHIYVEHRSGHTGKVMRHLLPDALRWMWGGIPFKNPK